MSITNHIKLSLQVDFKERTKVNGESVIRKWEIVNIWGMPFKANAYLRSYKLWHIWFHEILKFILIKGSLPRPTTFKYLRCFSCYLSSCIYMFFLLFFLYYLLRTHYWIKTKLLHHHNFNHSLPISSCQYSLCQTLRQIEIHF